MTDTEVRKFAKTVPKPDIGVPHSVLQTFDDHGEVTFRHMLGVGQHLFKQFAAGNSKPPQKPRSLLKICTQLNVPHKKVYEILKGEKYLGDSASYKRKLTTPIKKTQIKVPKTENASASTTNQ